MTNRRGRGLIFVGGLLLCAITAAPAQNLSGLWGSTFYRVQLTVAGANVTGTFTPLDNPQAPAGQITGQVQPDGKSFTANWTFPVGPDTGAFSTWLTLTGKGSLLGGYRWAEETQPTSFALHRAVQGELVAVIDQDGAGGPTGGGTGGTAGGATNGTTGGTTTGPPPPFNFEVITCEKAVDGEPHNAGDQFVAPKSIVALVRYTNLPANSTVDWVWTLDGKPEARLTKTLNGTGWHCHGLQSQTTIIPGTYEIALSVNGKVVTRRTITVRAAGGGTTATGTIGGTTSTANQPGVEVIVCESAPKGEPQKPGTQFTKPKSLVCLIKYRNLPDNAQLKWVWKRPSGQTTEYVKTVSGTGWATHGFSSDTAMTPGTYQVTVYAAGGEVTTVTVAVR